MIDRWIIRVISPMIIAFIMRQIEQFKEGTDFEKVKADIEPRIRAAVPGTWLDNQAVALAHHLIDVVASVLSSKSDLEHLIGLILQQKWQEAVSFLQELLRRYISIPSFSAQAQGLEADIRECVNCL